MVNIFLQTSHHRLHRFHGPYLYSWRHLLHQMTIVQLT